MRKRKQTIGGIYFIFIDTKFYIGSSKNLNRRNREHLNLLKLGSHYNIRMQNTFNKYNKYEFQIFEIIQSDKELLKAEQAYIDIYYDDPNCMNISRSSDCATRGRKVSDETKEKLRIVNTGRKHTEETKAKMKKNNYLRIKKKTEVLAGTWIDPSTKIQKKEKTIKRDRTGVNAPNYGKKHTEETKEKMRKARIGKVCSDETREKLRVLNTGRKFSEIHLKNMSKSMSGPLHPNYGKRGKLSPMYGRKLSSETRSKMSKANSGALNANFGKKLGDTFVSIEYLSGESKIFNSTRDAAKYLNIGKSSVHKWIKDPPLLNMDSKYYKLNIKNIKYVKNRN